MEPVTIALIGGAVIGLIALVKKASETFEKRAIEAERKRHGNRSEGTKGGSD